MRPGKWLRALRHINYLWQTCSQIAFEIINHTSSGDDDFEKTAIALNEKRSRQGKSPAIRPAAKKNLRVREIASELSLRKL
jgi:hypothetical protein